MKTSTYSFDTEFSSEEEHFGLGIQRWTLLVVAFFLGLVSIYSIGKMTTVLHTGPSSAVAAPDVTVKPLAVPLIETP